MQSRIRRFPNHHIAQQCRRPYESCSQCREVERTDSIDKTFQWPKLIPIPRPIQIHRWLLFKQLLRLLNILPQKVDRLRRCVHFRLPDILSHPQHRRSQNLRAIFPTDQLCGTQEYCRSIFKGKSLPRRLGCQRGIDGGVGILLGRRSIFGHFFRMSTRVELYALSCGVDLRRFPR